MKLFRLLPLFLAGALLAPVFGADAKPVMPSGDAKKLAARYALTKTRIDGLLAARLNPAPLPAGALPNPFYKPDATLATAPNTERIEAPVVPDAPDLSDADTLTKYAATLKVGGYLTVGGQPHVAVNQVICKVGDVITVGTKEHPVFLRIEAITPQEFTIRLNDVSYNVPLRK